MSRKLKLKEGFRVRSSSSATITAKGMGKSLSAGAKTYIRTEALQDFFDRDFEIFAKQMDKGIIQEGLAIDFVSEHFFGIPLCKNEMRLTNDFNTGECDVFIPNWKGERTGAEIKNSWDIPTFPYFDDKPNSAHVKQVQSYIDLYNTKGWHLFYLLMDHTEDELEKQERFMAKQMGEDEVTPEVVQAVLDRFTYGDLDPRHRMRHFYIERDQEFIDRLHEYSKLGIDYHTEQMEFLSKFGLDGVK